MPGWLCDIVTSDPFYLVVGALLAGLIGYVTTRINERQNLAARRKALAGLMHGQLESYGTPSRPSERDPPSADPMHLTALPLLLAPGVLDPQREWDLLMHVVFMESIQANYNDKARNYNIAWLNGASKELLWECEKDLIMSSWDYRDARKQMLRMIGRLGPPLPLEWSYEPTRRERVLHWFRMQVRKVRPKAKAAPARNVPNAAPSEQAEQPETKDSELPNA